MKTGCDSSYKGLNFYLSLPLLSCLISVSHADNVALTSSSVPQHSPHQVSFVENEQGLYVAKVELNTPEELKDLFDRAEGYLANSQGYNGSSPIEVVLHGPEVRVFQRKNYQQFKLLVDQAARLDAYNIIDVRVCELWMSADNVTASELPSFVDTVPSGPEYTRQLLNSGYSHF
jgi:intracellular sulfur oxidation DsrE/DsrF family protein